MTRHPFRWEGLAFGLFFLAIVANWSVWKQDLLTTRQLSLAASGVLIFLGLIGVAATIWRGRPAPALGAETAPHTTHDLDTEAEPVPEGPTHDQEADPQP
jgi:hypothetical protein